MTRRSTRRADLAAVLAGILIGGLAGAGAVVAAGGGHDVVTCTQPGTGVVLRGADCRVTPAEAEAR